ncbi:PE family protein [Mycobacterium sp.]|uniref:PE family protein n=1 Tax=Mycobacterium sp. TaxID=1785 RepID=UPI003A883E5F
MSYVFAGPAALEAAASDLGGIGSAISDANASAAGPTAGIPAAAADQVSAVVANFWDAHAQGYQQISAQMAAFHDQFVKAVSASGAAYADTDTATASGIHDLLGPPRSNS